MSNKMQSLRNKTANRVIAALLTLVFFAIVGPVAVLADGYTKQGGELKVHMVDPGAEYISTSRLENNDYLNEISIAYDTSSPVVFTIDIGDGSGTNHLNLSEFNGYVKVFTSQDLSEASQVYSFGTDADLTMEDIGTQTTLQRGRKYKLSIGGLEKGTTYYLAFLKGMQSSQRGATLGDNNILFEFSTLSDTNAVDSVSLDKKGLLFDGVDQTYTLKATINPAGATNKSVAWSSSDATVASVDANGKVTALKAGTATITVTTVDGNKTADCKVTVREAENKRILTSVSGTQIVADTEAKYTIDRPVVYKDIENGRYLVLEEADLEELPVFGITMIPNGGRKGTTFHTHVYSDEALTTEIASAGNGITADIPDYTAGTFTLDPSKFEAGKTYYFVVDKDSTCGGARLTEDIVIEFSVAKAEEPEPFHTHTEAAPVRENEVAATCKEAGSYDEVVYCSECKAEISREKKTVEKLPHTEEVIQGKAATCTATGLTDGKKCSVCGEILVEQEEISAKGHSPVVTKGTPATCTEKGLTDGSICSECGKVFVEQEPIAALGHDYKDGKCSRCGAEDPDYKPAEPEKHYDGVVKGPDGKWAYYEDDVLQKDYTGIKKNDYGWWRIEKGLVNFNATGVYKNEYGWWRVENGKVNFNAQGIYKNAYGWWKTTDGKVTFNETGVFKNDYGWWRVEKSKVNFKANGIYKNDYGWWKTTNGKVTFKENGVFKNEYGTWYVQKSKVDFSKNGKVTYNGKTYQVTNGKAKAI